MENKKIVDYKVVSGDLSHFNEFENELVNDIINCNSELNSALNKLQNTKEKIETTKLKLEVLNSLLQLEVGKENQPIQAKEIIRIKYLLDIHAFYENEPFTITLKTNQMRLHSKNQFEESLLSLEKKLKNIQSDIENLNLKIDVLTEINSKIERFEIINSITRRMQHLASQGYVLQGGFYTRDDFGYQAMVKYED